MFNLSCNEPTKDHFNSLTISTVYGKYILDKVISAKNSQSFLDNAMYLAWRNKIFYYYYY